MQIIKNHSLTHSTLSLSVLVAVSLSFKAVVELEFLSWLSGSDGDVYVLINILTWQGMIPSSHSVYLSSAWIYLPSHYLQTPMQFSCFLQFLLSPFFFLNTDFRFLLINVFIIYFLCSSEGILKDHLFHSVNYSFIKLVGLNVSRWLFCHWDNMIQRTEHSTP